MRTVLRGVSRPDPVVLPVPISIRSPPPGTDHPKPPSIRGTPQCVRLNAFSGQYGPTV
jgi:hypothetical protein